VGLGNIITMTGDTPPQRLPLPPILPVGTKVVARVQISTERGERVHAPGAVGVIVKSPVDPVHAYRIRFLDVSKPRLSGMSWWC